MDDIIIIIITLVVMVIGAVNQFRKKQKQPLPGQEETGENNEVGFFESLLNEEETPGHDFHEVAPEPKLEPAPVKAAEARPIILQTSQERERAIISESIEDEIKKMEIGLNRQKPNLPDNFSLRNAVIFSEILKHKYF